VNRLAIPHFSSSLKIHVGSRANLRVDAGKYYALAFKKENGVGGGMEFSE
jgi:hypothetical protein